MVVSTPVKHSRLATALVKSTSLLRWQSTHAGGEGGKQGAGGAPLEPFAVFKGWRSRKQPPSAAQFLLLDETRRCALHRLCCAACAALCLLYVPSKVRRVSVAPPVLYCL